MNRYELAAFQDELEKIAQGAAGAATKILRGVLTRDPSAKWRTATHAMRRSQRLSKVDKLRSIHEAKKTGGLERLLAEGKITRQQAVEAMKMRKPSPTTSLRGSIFPAEGTQVAGVPTKVIRGIKPSISAAPVPAQRSGVMSRVGKWYGGLAPSKRMTLGLGATSLGAGAGYAAG